MTVLQILLCDQHVVLILWSPCSCLSSQVLVPWELLGRAISIVESNKMIPRFLVPLGLPALEVLTPCLNG